MTSSEFILVKSVIEGPIKLPGEDLYTLVCSIETQDGKTAVDEIKGTFKDCYGLEVAVEFYGTQQVEAVWTEDATSV